MVDHVGDVFRIKHIDYLDSGTVATLMQNENGPCPLLAISNILLLNKKIHLHPDLAFVDFRYLVQLVGNYLVEANPPHPDAAMQSNQQQQIADALAVLPKLGRGLDVNVKFQKIMDFEYTNEMSVLDMLGVNLVHGWLCDPQDVACASVIRDMSYNQLICMLVDADAVQTVNQSSAVAEKRDKDPAMMRVGCISKHTCTEGSEWAALPSVVTWLPGLPLRPVSEGHTLAAEIVEALVVQSTASPESLDRGAQDDGDCQKKLLEKLRIAQVVEGFMQDTASQLTYYGLVQLHQDVREGELCVFFRNNHFCTMKRHKDELYLLVTDVGYYEQEKIVWEKLADVSGDNAFCDATFSVYHPSRTIRPVATVSLESVQNALSNFASGVGITASAPPSAQVGVGGQASAGAPARSAAEQEDADMALALSLQSKFEEEERRRQQQAQLQSQQQARGGVTGAPVRGGASSAASRQIASSGTAGDQMTNYRLSQQERHVQQGGRSQGQLGGMVQGVAQERPVQSAASGVAQGRPATGEHGRSSKKDKGCVLQ